MQVSINDRFFAPGGFEIFLVFIEYAIMRVQSKVSYKLKQLLQWKLKPVRKKL